MEKEDVCPICENSLTDVYRNHFNMVGGAHSMYRSAECKNCGINVIEDTTNGCWITSRHAVEFLENEISLDEARSIFEVHELQNKNVEKNFGLTEKEAIDFCESNWVDFVNSMKEKDKVYTWKESDNYSLVLVRSKFIINAINFQKL